MTRTALGQQLVPYVPTLFDPGRYESQSEALPTSDHPTPDRTA